MKMKRHLFRNGLKSFHKLWLGLFRPQPQPVSATVSAVHKSRLLNGFLIVIFLIILGVDITYSLTSPNYQPPWFGYGMIGLAFILNRMGWYFRAALITMAMFPIVIFSLVYSGTAADPSATLHYLPLGLILGSIFIRKKAIIGLALLNVIGIALIPVVLPGRFPLAELIGPFSATLIGGGLIVLLMEHRHQIERDRQIELQTSETRYRQLFENAGLGIGYFDSQGVVISFNKISGDNLGGAPTDFVGRSMVDLFGETVGSKYLGRIQATLEANQSQFYEDQIALPGGTRWFKSTYTPIDDPIDQALGVQIISDDITIKKLAEDAYYESQQRLLEAQRATGIGSWEFDYQQAHFIWSAETYQQFGLDINHGAVSYAAFLALVPPEWHDYHVQKSQELELKGKAEYEYQIRRPDGEQRWIWSLGKLVRDSAGFPIRLIGMSQDITARKELETQLQNNIDQLEALQEVSLAITSQLDLDELLKSIVTRAVSLLGGTKGGFGVYEATNDCINYQVYSGKDPLPTNRSLARGEGFLGQILAIGQPLIIENYQTWPERSPQWEDVLGPVANIGVPVIWGDEILGVLDVMDQAPRKFTPADIEMLAALATQAAISIRNAKLFEQATNEITARKRSEVIITARLRLMEFVTDHPLRAVLQKTLDEICELVQSPVGFYHFVEADQKTLVLQAWSTRTVSEFCEIEGSGMHYSIDQAGVWVDCVRERKPVIHNDYATLPHHQGLPPGHAPVTRELVVPIFRQEKIVAILGVGNKPGLYDQQDVELVSYFADLAWEIAERKQAAEQLERKLREEKTLRTISNTLTLAFETESVLEDILVALKDVLPFNMATVILTEKDYLRMVATNGLDPQVKELKIPRDNPLIQELHETKKPLLIEDVSQDRRYKNMIKRADARSWMGFPLIDHGNVFGTFIITHEQPDHYSAQDMNFVQSFANHASAALSRARMFAQINRRAAQLQMLHEIDQLIVASVDQNFALERILQTLLEGLKIDAAVILEHNLESFSLSFLAGRGIKSAALQNTHLRLGEGYAGTAAINQQMVRICNLADEDIPFVRSLEFNSEKFITYYGIPLIAKGELKGVLEIFHRTPLDWDQNQDDFLQNLGTQIAIALDNLQLYSSLSKANMDLQLAYDTTLEGWGKTLELRDQETEGHSQRVTDLTVNLARAYGLSGPEIVQIRRGAMLHDIGKMGIPDSILQKPGPLNETEWEIMHQHPQLAYNFLKGIPFLQKALEIPYSHHEKWDGSGYPRGLKSQQIPLGARLFAIVDVYDALSSDRPYRQAWPQKKVRNFLQEQSGKHFDPHVVDVFLSIIGEGEGWAAKYNNQQKTARSY
jgi:PAS domain S-box-containing protein